VREYELMLILDPTLDEEGLQGASTRIQTLVGDRGGEMIALEASPPWGRRRLAYPIKRFRDGIYTIARFNMAPSGADELERNLKLSDQVVRYLLVVKN